MCQPWDMVTLTDISALEKMAQDGLLAELGSPRSGEGLPWGETSMRAVHHVNLPALGTCLSADAPAHVLVSSPRERVRSGTVVSHVWSGPLPDRSLFRLSDDVLMASPGLVLAQMATSTPLPELAAVVMEMCGRYGRVRWSSRGFLDRKLLTTPQNLREYLCSLPGHLCIQRAERATQFALVGSRSPLETSFALMVSLPEELGGCGFARPRLNHRIDPSPQLAALCDQGWYEADLCWPEQRVICEVNSRQEHLTPQAQDHDAAKTGALEAMGWRVHPVTVGLLKSTTSREALFGQIARSLGCPAPGDSPEEVRRRGDLVQRLLEW